MAVGGTLGPGTLEALRLTDDQGVIVVDGQLLHAEFASTYGRITVDGQFADWLAGDRIDISANTVTGYALYGTFTAGNYLIGIQATNSSDVVVGPGTTIWLNTDWEPNDRLQSGLGFHQCRRGVQRHLRQHWHSLPLHGRSGRVQGQHDAVDFAMPADGKSLEIALPQTWLTPAGGTAPTSIGLAAVINSSVFLPGDYSTAVPEYTIKAPAPLQTYGSITVDGNFSDWTAAQRIDTAANSVTGYTLYGTVSANTYLIALPEHQFVRPGDRPRHNHLAQYRPETGPTGYNLPWGFTNVGAEYNVTFDSTGTPYLYTGAAGQTLVSTTPLNYALSADGKSLEIAIPKSLVTPVAARRPASINMAAVINNSVYLPGNYSTTTPEYTINDPSVTPKTYGWITVDGSFGGLDVGPADRRARRMPCLVTPFTGRLRPAAT